MGKYGNFAKNLIKSGGETLSEAAKAGLLKAGKHLDDIGGDFKKFDPTVFKNSDGLLDEDALKGLQSILKRDGVPLSKRLDLAAKTSKMTDAISDANLAKSVDNSLGEVGDALSKSKSFFEKNKNVLMAAGLTTTGIAMAMLLLGNKSPAAVAGIPKEKLDPDSTGGIDDEDDAGDDDEGGGGGNRKKRVLEDFLKNWGVYIIILIVMIFIGVAVYIMTRGSTETLSENSG
jgi:hypothetical protein